ncbi:hypothetical protein C7M84_024685 [Penaeus vannamei]|uniref:CCHC-type domain-containing protein n=1 Tax=Penaeus vannamei TaxID=6689 RepID=A0A423U0F9_PENVA|nr:hypothetical protein C7M84_024685 [Penaeus vannamei]
MSHDARRNEQNEHQRIARLIKTGICPDKWCCVCGYALRRTEDAVKCASGICQNFCHVICLHGNSDFACDQTASLRDLAGIAVPVEFLLHNPPAEEAPVQPPLTEEEELLNLPSNQLITIVRNLRAELSRKNSLLTFFNTFSENLASKRDAVVTVLQLIDNIQATKSSIDSLEVNSIACTANAERIDKEWCGKTNTHSAAKAWWTSGKPRPLKSCFTQPPPLPEAPETADQEAQSYSHTLSLPQSSNTFPDPNHSHTSVQLRQRCSRDAYAQPRHRSRHTSPQPQRRRTRRPSSQQQHHVSQRQPTQPQRSDKRNSFCQNCKIKGHSQEDCRKNQFCEFCHRHGHEEQSCRTKLSEERQERLFRSLSAEQSHNNNILVQTLQRQLSLLPHLNSGLLRTSWPGVTPHQAHHPYSGWPGATPYQHHQLPAN